MQGANRAACSPSAGPLTAEEVQLLQRHRLGQLQAAAAIPSPRSSCPFIQSLGQAESTGQHFNVTSLQTPPGHPPFPFMRQNAGSTGSNGSKSSVRSVGERRTDELQQQQQQQEQPSVHALELQPPGEGRASHATTASRPHAIRTTPDPADAHTAKGPFSPPAQRLRGGSGRHSDVVGSSRTTTAAGSDGAINGQAQAHLRQQSRFPVTARAAGQTPLGGPATAASVGGGIVDSSVGYGMQAGGAPPVLYGAVAAAALPAGESSAQQPPTWTAGQPRLLASAPTDTLDHARILQSSPDYTPRPYTPFPSVMSGGTPAGAGSSGASTSTATTDAGTLVLSAVVDITARKLAEDRMRQVFEASPSGACSMHAWCARGRSGCDGSIHMRQRFAR